MTKVKRIIAIVSVILLFGTIIYQVSAYERVDEYPGETAVALDGDAGETVTVDDEEVEADEGEAYLLEEVEESIEDELDDATADDTEDESASVDSDEAMERSYIGIAPFLSLPVGGPAVRRVDYTTNQEKEPQFFWTFAEELPYLSIYVGELIPANWEISHWSIHYYVSGGGPTNIRYDTVPGNNILRHVMPDDAVLESGYWVMMPTFQIFFTPIPPTLTGTVTCITCPEGDPGLPMAGVTIRLHYVCEEEGEVVRSAITDENGFFDFGQVPFGDLRLVKEHETVPEGHISIQPRVIELTTATPGGAYEEHFFVECKEPPTLTKDVIYINDEDYEDQVVVEGDIITYRLRVHNPNPRPWSNFLVVDVLPDGLSLVGDVLVVPASALEEDLSTQAGVNVIINLPAGPGNVDILFTARVDDVTLAVDGYFVNVATLYGPPENGGERPPIDDCDAEVPAEPPGISLVKVVSEPIAEPGDTLTYTLVVRNTGGAVLTNVVVTDDLPSQLTNPRNLVITPEEAGVGSFEGQLLTVTIPRLGLEESVTITFDVTVAADVEKGTEIVNVAEVTTDQNVYDEDEETVVVDYEPPQLTTPGISIVKSVSSETVEAGGTLTYTITVRNTGDEVLTNVVVTDNLPIQLTNPRNLVVTPPNAGTGSFVGQLLTVNIPVLGIDETVIIVFDVTVAEDVANDTVIRNVATVTTDQGPSDEDDATTTVTEQPPTHQPPGQAPRTGDIGVLETTLFMFIAGATALVMFSLLKTERKKTRRK